MSCPHCVAWAHCVALTSGVRHCEGLQLHILRSRGYSIHSDVLSQAHDWVSILELGPEAVLEVWQATSAQAAIPAIYPNIWRAKPSKAVHKTQNLKSQLFFEIVIPHTGLCCKKRNPAACRPFGIWHQHHTLMLEREGQTRMHAR